MGSVWQGEPVWFHGDLAVGNLLVHDGRLSAFVDVGQTGVGDPACDLTIAWTLFRGGDRQAFVEALGEQGRDPELWERARGWALWKALLSTRNPDDGLFAGHAAALPEILAAGETGAWPPALTT
ncbi:phosphotransferase [Aestuariimicrobium soli]|uniref:phosphotransferase n=1 Tax=Aestuariimicrobium soli TaxID=2035834 RepID=UPI003EBA2BF6